MTVRLIGGEMLVWSDLDGRHGPGPVGGAVLATLVAAVEGRMLVAGPHDPALIDALRTGDLTILVRGVADADLLAERYADRPGVTVCCGAIEKLAAAEPPYDVVVALDGVSRVCTAEDGDLAWDEAFALLVAVLRPGGRLLLGTENLLGLHRLAALPPAETDSDWAPAAEYDETRPAGPEQVRARVTVAGLDVVHTYAAYPAPIEPTVLLDADVLADGSIGGFVESALLRACTPGGPALTDPGRLAVASLRHGAAAHLAPAWVMLAVRTAPRAVDADGVHDGLPAAVIADGSRVWEVRRDGAAGWNREAADGSSAVPVGRTLERLVIGACLRRDMPAVRMLLGAWQEGPTAGVPAEHVIVGPAGDLVAAAAASDPVAALRRLAATLLTLPHPWPAVTDTGELAVLLAAAAGREFDPAVVVDDEPGRADTGTLRNLVAERDRLARQVSELTDHRHWYERMLDSRQEALEQTQRTVELLAGSGAARAGMALVGGIRVARRSASVALRRIRPRG